MYQLSFFSFDRTSTIISALGHPLYTEHRNLTPNRFGLVKVKVVMELDKKFPPAVRVRDKLDNSVIVSAKFPHVPHKCTGCYGFGHLPLRCPKLIAHPNTDSKDTSSGNHLILPVINTTESTFPSKLMGSVNSHTSSIGVGFISSKVLDGSTREITSSVVRNVVPSPSRLQQSSQPSLISELEV